VQNNKIKVQNQKSVDAKLIGQMRKNLYNLSWGYEYIGLLDIRASIKDLVIKHRHSAAAAPITTIINKKIISLFLTPLSNLEKHVRRR
jgi:hypothetical protein